MNKEALVRAGIDYAGGVHRFAEKEQIYEKYLLKFFNVNELPALRQALEGGDYETAFRIAHNLKGGAGNLSIAAFYNKICELVEALRAGTRDGSLLVMCGDAEKLYETARCAVEEETHGQTH